MAWIVVQPYLQHLGLTSVFNLIPWLKGSNIKQSDIFPLCKNMWYFSFPEYIWWCCVIWCRSHTDYSRFGFIYLFFSLSMQCMHSNDACTSVSGETIIKMMMNSKTSTKPLVVISGESSHEYEDDQINKRMPGKT